MLREINTPNISLCIQDLFSEAAKHTPEKIAIKFKKDYRWAGISYAALKQTALNIASYLQAQGAKKGSHIALISENCPEWIEVYLGAIYAGMVCVPVDCQLSALEIENLVADSQSEFIFCSENIFSKKINAGFCKRLQKIIILEGDSYKGNNEIAFSQVKNYSPEGFVQPPINPEDNAELIYTSGTTADPKGVMLTHRNICSNFMSIYKLRLCSPSDNFIALLPLHHTYPFMVTVIVPLFYGATITFVPQDFNPKNLSKTIKESGVTVITGVPQLFFLIHNTISESLRKIPLILRAVFSPILKLYLRNIFASNLRFMISGGARLETKICRNMLKWGFKIIEGYGLTEASPVVTFNSPGRVKFGSVGKPLPDVKVRIDNPDKNGIGEVLIQGPNVMKGYFKHPEETALALAAGWLHSGDLGYIDKDGYVFITGRLKEIIVLSSGKNIYPDELEKYYSQSKYIKEICIFQVEKEAFGNKVDSLNSVIVPDLDYFRQQNEGGIQAKIKWELENLSAKLPAYKHIMGFVLTREELPKSTLGKLQRHKIRDKYLRKQSSSQDQHELILDNTDKDMLNNDLAIKVIKYLSSQLKLPVYLDSHLELDLGIDSLTRVEMSLGLEKNLNIRLAENIFSRIATVRELVKEILNLTDNNKGKVSSIETGNEQDLWKGILRETPETLGFNSKIRTDLRKIDLFLGALFKLAFEYLFRVVWFLRVKGKENIPRKGPFLIAPNHCSYLDGFLIFSSLPLKASLNTYFLGYSKIFKHPLIRWAVGLARLIPSDPLEELVVSMQAASFVLSKGKVVCIFPEGRRSFNGKLGEFKSGIGILAKELDIPIIPVYIKGSYSSWPRLRLFPRPYPIKIIFGEPYSYRDLVYGKEDSGISEYEIIAERLKEKVIQLIC